MAGNLEPGAEAAGAEKGTPGGEGTLEERLSQLADRLGGRKRLAEAAQMPESTLYRYLRGESQPAVDVLVALARAGGASVEWLATGEGTPEGPDQVDSLVEDLTFVPRYDLAVSAGSGVEVKDEQVLDRLAFKTTWLRHTLGANPKDLVVVTVDGDSMEPTISSGDIVLVNRAQTDPGRAGIYVVRMDESLLIKRLQLLPGGAVQATGDNPAYQSFTFPLAQPEHRLAIIGRVVWLGHRF